MADNPAPSKTGEKIRQEVVDKTGFEPNDLLTAPVKPPELKNTRPALKPEQSWAIVIGFAVAVLGLIIFAVTASFIGGIIMAVGALAIAIATLIRI